MSTQSNNTLVSVNGYVSQSQRYGLPAEAVPDQRVLTEQSLVMLLGQRFRHWRLELGGYLSTEIPPWPWSFLPIEGEGYLWLVQRKFYPPANSAGDQNVYLRIAWKVQQRPGDPIELYSVGGLECAHTRDQVDKAYAALKLFYEPMRGHAGGRTSRIDDLSRDSILRAELEKVRKRITSGRYTWRQAVAGIALFDTGNPDAAVRQAQRWVTALNELENS